MDVKAERKAFIHPYKVDSATHACFNVIALTTHSLQLLPSDSCCKDLLLPEQLPVQLQKPSRMPALHRKLMQPAKLQLHAEAC